MLVWKASDLTVGQRKEVSTMHTCGEPDMVRVPPKNPRGNGTFLFPDDCWLQRTMENIYKTKRVRYWHLKCLGDRIYHFYGPSKFENFLKFMLEISNIIAIVFMYPSFH